MNRKAKSIFTLLAVLIYVFSMLFMETHADPVGATISNVTTVTGSWSPDSRADDGGTITTLIINVTQQNFAWKAYIGNITASLTLDDNNGKTIYDWTLAQGSLSGELYSTRFGSVSWSGIACASQSNIASEHTTLSMGAGDIDNINKTFSSTKHPAMEIAGTTLSNSTCKSLFTFYNETSQQDNEASKFSEILVQNTDGNIIYVTNLESDETAYSGGNVTYDFQMLVPDNDAANNITIYYFYAEIDS